MRPLDEWHGQTTIETFEGRTPAEAARSVASLDAYVAAFDADAALGCHEPMTAPERDAVRRHRVALAAFANRARRTIPA